VGEILFKYWELSFRFIKDEKNDKMINQQFTKAQYEYKIQNIQAGKSCAKLRSKLMGLS
jgi:hypothetical protein